MPGWKGPIPLTLVLMGLREERSCFPAPSLCDLGVEEHSGPEPRTLRGAGPEVMGNQS